MQFAQWCSHWLAGTWRRQIKRHSEEGGQSQAATSPDSCTDERRGEGAGSSTQEKDEVQGVRGSRTGVHGVGDYQGGWGPVWVKTLHNCWHFASFFQSKFPISTSFLEWLLVQLSNKKFQLHTSYLFYFSLKLKIKLLICSLPFKIKLILLWYWEQWIVFILASYVCISFSITKGGLWLD